MAAKTTAPTSEIRTSSVMNLRAPALMPLLYVATMWRTHDTAYIPIAIGTVAWIVAGIVLWIMQREQSAWIAVCAVGALAGLGGLIYLNIRARRPGISYE
jgi:Na+/melibiose symporter-like transporter